MASLLLYSLVLFMLLVPRLVKWCCCPTTSPTIFPPLMLCLLPKSEPRAARLLHYPPFLLLDPDLGDVLKAQVLHCPVSLLLCVSFSAQLCLWCSPNLPPLLLKAGIHPFPLFVHCFSYCAFFFFGRPTHCIGCCWYSIFCASALFCFVGCCTFLLCYSGSATTALCWPLVYWCYAVFYLVLLILRGTPCLCWWVYWFFYYAVCHVLFFSVPRFTVCLFCYPVAHYY